MLKPDIRHSKFERKCAIVYQLSIKLAHIHNQCQSELKIYLTQWQWRVFTLSEPGGSLGKSWVGMVPGGCTVHCSRWRENTRYYFILFAAMLLDCLLSVVALWYLLYFKLKCIISLLQLRGLYLWLQAIRACHQLLIQWFFFFYFLRTWYNKLISI